MTRIFGRARFGAERPMRYLVAQLTREARHAKSNALPSPLSRFRRFRRPPLYAYPWFALLDLSAPPKLLPGLQSLAHDDEESRSAVLRGTAYWRWYVNRHAVFVQCLPAPETEHVSAADVMKAAGSALKRVRPRLPLNGVILTVSPSRMTEEAAVALGRGLAALAEAQHAPLPVYLVVAVGDASSYGLTDFAACVPERMRTQAFGSLIEQGGFEAGAVAEAFDRLCERSYAVLVRQSTEASLDAMLFRRAFRAHTGVTELREGLTAFAKELLGQNRINGHFFARGVFLRDAEDEDLFLDEFVTRILPEEQSVAVVAAYPGDRRSLCARLWPFWGGGKREEALPYPKQEIPR